MGALVGYRGNVSLSASTVANAHAWNLDVSADNLDTTPFSTTGWKTGKAGLKGWTGSVDLYTDDTTRVLPSDMGTEVTATFYLSDSLHNFNGKALITGWNPAVTVDGIETQTLSLTGSSDLFYSAS